MGRASLWKNVVTVNNCYS